MLGLLLDKYREARARSRLAARELRLQESVLDQLSLWGAGAAVDDDEMVLGLDSLLRQREYGVSRSSGYRQSAHALNRAVALARNMYETNPFARNLVNQVVNHTVGRGFKIEFDLAADADEWRDASRQIRWQKRRREIPRRVMRDGEALVRKFGPGVVRFVEPEHLQPTGEHSAEFPLGVVTDPDDVETVVGYDVGGETVPAEEVFHFKCPDVDMSELRCWPPLVDSKRWIDDYVKFVADRSLLNRWRASVLAVRKQKGASQSELAAFQDRIKQGTLTRPGGQQVPVDLFRNRGRILNVNDDVDYEFKSPNVGAQDAAEDGRASRLLIAVMWSFPEYLVTSDASNANFASTAVAESPGVKTMEAHQDHFGGDFCLFVEWVLGHPVDMRIFFPALYVRNELQQTQARAIRYQNGVLSAETWMRLDGVDPEEERSRLDNPS